MYVGVLIVELSSGEEMIRVTELKEMRADAVEATVIWGDCLPGTRVEIKYVPAVYEIVWRELFVSLEGALEADNGR